MELLLVKTVHGLGPGDDHAKEQLRRIKIHQLVRCDVKRARNGAHHRKMFALLDTVWQATGDWPSVNALLTDLKFRIGHTIKHRLTSPLKWDILGDDGEILATITIPKGTVVEVPDSIAFSSMDQGEFEQFYERALHELADMAGGIDDSVLRNSVLEQLH